MSVRRACSLVPLTTRLCPLKRHITMGREVSEGVTEQSLNPNVLKAEYAVRGEIVARASEIQKELAAGKKFPFDKVVMCNIGNPQALGQQPLTFLRQVLAVCDYSPLLENEDAKKIFPSDVLERAKLYLDNIGSTGAYSESRGAAICREQIAEGIERRDGFPANPEHIFICDGASAGVHLMMRSLLRDESDAILTPIPQYPLYSAAIALYGGHLLPYYLDETHEWGMNVEAMEQQVKQAESEGKTVRGLVVINPGNPCGQVLTQQNQKDIIKFAAKHKLVLLADEVYQDNIYHPDKEWVSFKKVLRDLEGDHPSCALASMHSVSKGFYGECGRRGGYLELVGFPEGVLGQLGKLASISLCSNVPGQLTMAMVMNPPKEGEPSFELYQKERAQLLGSLKKRAKWLEDALNKMEGVSCNPAEGALYAMPRLHLPKKACEEAAKIGKSPDFFYCKSLLEETGVTTVPGSGFKQAEGTFHFRTTFLPSEADIGAVCDRMTAFHKSFIKKYGPLEDSETPQNGVGQAV